MFYCDECATLNKWPETIAKSAGLCEVCNRNRACNDRPSHTLPEGLTLVPEGAIPWEKVREQSRVASNTTPSWSPEWPTREGWWWFYGRCGQVKYPLLAVEVVAKVDGTLAYCARGRQLIGATGLWLPLETPTLPEEVGS